MIHAKKWDEAVLIYGGKALNTYYLNHIAQYEQNAHSSVTDYIALRQAIVNVYRGLSKDVVCCYLKTLADLPALQKEVAAMATLDVLSKGRFTMFASSNLVSVPKVQQPLESMSVLQH